MVRIEHDRGRVRAVGERYEWEWLAEDDLVSVRDTRGRMITSGRFQPSVLTKPVGDAGSVRAVPGRPVPPRVGDDCVTVSYEGVNGTARMTLTWRFDEHGMWLDPLTYETDAAEDVVSVVYFGEARADGVHPALESSHHVIPALSNGSGVSPIVQEDAKLRMTTCLGASAFSGPGLHQQWGLPAHYFCGFHRNAHLNAKGAMTDALSDAFCFGLAELPDGDFWLRIVDGSVSPWLFVGSDLWGHRRGPGSFTIGPRMLLTTGPTYHDAIRNYYRALLRERLIRSKATTNSDRKTEVALTPEFNTWGAQVARGLQPEQFSEPVLEAIYDELRLSGMRAGMFVVDDKWEGRYGVLAHDEDRFPHFEEFLQRVRDDGYLVGLWAAFLRCEDPSLVGLTHSHMLRRPDGTPFEISRHHSKYFIFDVTQPEVQRILRETARRFIRRYRPDLVKFDFGYELPALSSAAPMDLRWAGERLLQKGLEVIIDAMKEENPDLVVMYYGLSPLLADYYDLLSLDDLCRCVGDYDLAANRRIFLSGLCGEFGMPTYGSSGYDWASSPNIWFDSAAVGTVGSLHNFSGDETDGGPRPEWIAKYNGVTQALRRSCSFSIEPLDANLTSAAHGATASSWARHEGDNVTLVALRTRWLTCGDGTASYGDVLETDADVIVASQDAQDIRHAQELAIVPFGTGEVVLQRSDVSHAEVTEHYLAGGTATERIEIPSGRLRIPLRERAAGNKSVEWLHVLMGNHVGSQGK